LQFAKNKDSAKKTVKAKKEVILAAGAIHTPQILQVSGIGDSALLSSIDVPVVVDLPAVGQNFHDHVLLAVVGTSKSNPSLTEYKRLIVFSQCSYSNRKPY
jgi:choline dehydrogenase-like flavoprotein